MIPTLICLAALAPAPAAWRFDDPAVSHSVTIEAPVKDVWAAFTTSEGISGWMVARGTVDLRIGGKMRTSYEKDSKLEPNGPDVIENTIVSYDPERMLSIRCTKTPERFPFKKTMEHVWTVIYFHTLGPSKTEVTSRMLGWDGSEESNQMRQFFEAGNKQTMDGLAKYFEKKGLAASGRG